MAPRQAPQPRDRAARRRGLGAAAVLLATVSLGACGSSGGTKLTHATLILDFVPNAVHAGVYRAISAGDYRHEHIDLRVIPPTSTSATLALIAAGKADFGLADGSDVATQIADGRDAVAIMAIAQQPVGGLIALASEHLRSPAQLQGRTVGVTGVPSDTAVLDTEVRAAGGNPAKVHVVDVGFNGGQDLVDHRIDAFTGFWPDDGVQLQVSGHPITVFKLQQYGGPDYPGLVAFTTKGVIEHDPKLVSEFVAATVRGYNQTISDPRGSLNDLLKLNPGLQRRFTSASLEAYLPLYNDFGRVSFGKLRRRGIRAMSAWMLAHHLIKHRITPARYGTNRFLRGG